MWAWGANPLQIQTNQKEIKMTKKRQTALHEILAVEADKQGAARRVMDESQQVFNNKHNLFQGVSKRLSMDVEGQESLEKASRINQPITTTVNDRLQYTNNIVSDWLNVVCSKELANQGAHADVEIDGNVIIPNLPATYLLGLETKLRDVRNYYEAIPTLQPGLRWILDDDASNSLTGTYITAETEVKSKTQKNRKYYTMSEATKEHPAQIDITSEEVVVGQFKTDYTSGMIPAAEKARLLTNIQILLGAVKQARQRANAAPVTQVTGVGDALFNFIHSK